MSINIESQRYIETILGDTAQKFIAKSSEFMELLFEENKKYNLTAIKTEEDFWVKHVCDSISILKVLPWISNATLKIADIGAGAGFPSLPLALALPNSHFYAIDSSHKKTNFIVKAIEKLGISNLMAINGRGIELSRKTEWKSFFDIVMARAVGTAAEIFTQSSKMLKKEGIYVLYKTPDSANSEICELRKKSGGVFEWTVSSEFFLPCNAGRRAFILGKSKSICDNRSSIERTTSSPSRRK